MEVFAESRAAEGFVAAVEGRVGALGVGDDFAVQGHRDQDIGHHAELGVGLLLGFPDCLQVQAVELGQHVVHLDGGDAALFDRATQNVGDGLDATKGAKIFGVARLVLVGTAIVGMDAHNQAGNLRLDRSGW